jgi:hypothetical protein
MRILKSYLFWTYPRGSFHYDVMVTLILAFLFLSPQVINFRERPQETQTSRRSILVEPLGSNRLLYRFAPDQLSEAAPGAALPPELLQRIREVSGEVRIDRFQKQTDARGQVTEYRVWAHR